jgi:hypothetical protein
MYDFARYFGHDSRIKVLLNDASPRLEQSNMILRLLLKLRASSLVRMIIDSWSLIITSMLFSTRIVSVSSIFHFVFQLRIFLACFKSCFGFYFDPFFNSTNQQAVFVCRDNMRFPYCDIINHSGQIKSTANTIFSAFVGFLVRLHYTLCSRSCGR